ncbi:hypothetical protein ACIQAL_09325 [Pseudomonas sp. NPDC088368]|uniref:hypothetical protein n=1 Tax=Pseudomonas sp. NPDC088368 TaxID=3364453 RepID=UPI0037F3C158
MKDSQPNRYRDSISRVEDQVFIALQHLPSLYTAARGTLWREQIENLAGSPFRYKPDFEVTDQRGRKLFIEVKSERAMTLPNMIHFSAINDMFRHRPDTRFMVLVWGNILTTSKFSSFPEFQNLYIEHAENDYEARGCVLRVFESAFDR